MGDVGFVLLAGGTGSRMKATMPKQFLDLRGVPVLHHSLDLFLNRLPGHLQQNGNRGPPFVILVMDPKYQPEYQSMVDKYNGRLVLANPGIERQGSVQNGLAK
jgi:2-C-methyl-D-erythritol 4-phosphate cytidylyltransferase